MPDYAADSAPQPYFESLISIFIILSIILSYHLVVHGEPMDVMEPGPMPTLTGSKETITRRKLDTHTPLAELEMLDLASKDIQF